MTVVKESGLPYRIIEYGKAAQRPGEEELKHLVSLLDGPVCDLVRKDANFRLLNLQAEDYLDNHKAVVAILAEHIELMQRPILVRKGKAIIGRPKEKVPAFFK